MPTTDGVHLTALPEPTMFEVRGVPVPQGSKSAIVRGGRAVVVEASSTASRQRHAQWRADVTLAARAAHQGRPAIDGPARVVVTFRMPLPTSDKFRSFHATSPDLDKLLRALLDSIVNAGVLADDSRVCRIEATKVYAHPPNLPGAEVEVYDMTAVERGQRALLLGLKRGQRSGRGRPGA